MIKDSVLKKLAVHADERGKLFEILRSDDDIFESFGQSYITVCNQGWVKGWHYHKLQVDHFCVVRGEVKVVLCDFRKESKTYNEVNEHILSEKEPALLCIPAGVLHGFECLGNEPGFILNIPNRLYNRKEPDEYRIPLNSEEVPYQPWKNKKGW